MSHRPRKAFAFAAAALALAFRAEAGIVYDESLSDDLSGDGLAPTSISVLVGSNEIHGSTGRTLELGTDRDYFHITVPSGHRIVSLIERAGTTTVGGVSFIAVEAGTQVTVPTTISDATGLLGWLHYGPVDSDTDVLAALGSSGFGATDFVPPLPAGDYAFWIQDTGLGSSSYGFDIVVAVPEAGTAAALLLASLALGAARARPQRA
jgi:hypothetical protein